MKEHCHNCTSLAVNDRELATIIAALRFHQAENLQGSGVIPDQAICEIATDMSRLDALTFDDVEQLCQRLNLADRDVTTLAAFELPRRQNVPEGIQRIHDLLYLDEVSGREFYDPDKEWDADTISMVAEVVAQYVPRPGPGQEQMSTVVHAEQGLLASVATCPRKWKCPTCGRQVESSYEELAEVGAPYCSDCDSEMEMI